MKEFSTEDVVQYGMLVAETFNTYAKDKTSLTPEIAPDSLIAKNLVIDGYLVANDNVMSNIIKPVKDQCFYGILAHEKDNPQKYVTLIRGTGSTLEWIDDAKAAPQSYNLPGSGMVESGFYDIYTSMNYLPALSSQETNPVNESLSINAAEAISQVVTSHQGTLTITGHSLGSAIATYLMYDIARKPEMNDKTDMCLFASPKPGNQDFVDAFEKVTQNYVVYDYSLDMVPQVPPSFLGYQSLKGIKLLTPDNAQAQIKDNLLSNHHVVCYCAMLDYQYSNNWPQLLTENGDTPDCIIGAHQPTAKIGDMVKQNTMSHILNNIQTIRGTAMEMVANYTQSNKAVKPV
jgi:triacylglycerol lipase